MGFVPGLLFLEQIQKRNFRYFPKYFFQIRVWSPVNSAKDTRIPTLQLSISDENGM